MLNTLIIASALIFPGDNLPDKSEPLPADSVTVRLLTDDGGNTISGGNQEAEGGWGDDTAIETPSNSPTGGGKNRAVKVVRRNVQPGTKAYTLSGVPAPANYKGIVIIKK